MKQRGAKKSDGKEGKSRGREGKTLVLTFVPVNSRVRAEITREDVASKLVMVHNVYITRTFTKFLSSETLKI